jgi:hypothetical protein
VYIALIGQVALPGPTKNGFKYLDWRRATGMVSRFILYPCEVQLKHVNTGWEARIHPDDRELAATRYLQTVESGRGYEHPVEMRLVQPDGTVIDITYELQAERSSFGDCTGFVGVFSDVSSLRKLERDRIALERQRRQVLP